MLTKRPPPKCYKRFSISWMYITACCARRQCCQLSCVTAGAKQSNGSLQVTVKWADGVSISVPYEVLKKHVASSNALLDFMVARVKKREVPANA